MEFKNGLFALIEITDTTAVHLMTGDSQRIGLHGKLMKAEGRTVIAPVINSRGFARFNQEQLISLVESLGQEVDRETVDIIELGEAAFRLALGSPPDLTPFDTLVDQAAKLPDPDEDGVIRVKVKASHQKGSKKEATDRPKSKTSTTGAVWDIADQIKAENPDLPLKELRKLIMAKCEFEEIHPGTSGVQYSKWKQARGF